jgi:uncharacterized OsmC-like protein
MNAEELRALQAPLKARYREDAASARLVSRAEAVLLAERPSCRIETLAGPVVAGLHPLAGGDGSEACSLDMLLQALVACAGVTLNVVATAMGLALRSARVVAEAEGDIRGTLGLNKEVPVGATRVALHFEIDSDATDDQLATLLKQTERYCVIFQTLQHPPQLHSTLARVTG